MSAVSDYLKNAATSDSGELMHLREDQREALLEVISLAIYADGIPAVEEFEVVIEFIHELPAFADCTEEQLDALINSALQRLHNVFEPTKAAAEYARIAEQLGTPQLREAVFGLAMVVCMADGLVVPLEQEVLNQLTSAFELSKEQVDQIVQDGRAFIENYG